MEIASTVIEGPPEPNHYFFERNDRVVLVFRNGTLFESWVFDNPRLAQCVMEIAKSNAKYDAFGPARSKRLSGVYNFAILR